MSGKKNPPKIKEWVKNTSNHSYQPIEFDGFSGSITEACLSTLSQVVQSYMSSPESEPIWNLLEQVEPCEQKPHSDSV